MHEAQGTKHEALSAGGLRPSKELPFQRSFLRTSNTNMCQDQIQPYSTYY